MIMTVDGFLVETSDHPCGLWLRFSPQLYGIFNRTQAALWMRLRPEAQACLNPDLLCAMQRFGNRSRRNDAVVRFESGMGAHPFLICPVQGQGSAVGLPSSAEIQPAEVRYEIKVVDRLVADRAGETEAASVIRQSRPAQKALMRVRRRSTNLSRTERHAVVELRAKAAPTITERDLNRMPVRVKRQDQLGRRTQLPHQGLHSG